MILMLSMYTVKVIHGYVFCFKRYCWYVINTIKILQIRRVLYRVSQNNCAPFLWLLWRTSSRLLHSCIGQAST